MSFFRVKEESKKGKEHEYGHASMGKASLRAEGKNRNRYAAIQYVQKGVSRNTMSH